MTTVRQIDRLWVGGDHRRLLAEAAAGRSDLLSLAGEVGGPLAAAAVALIRLDELGQSHHPVAGRLIRSILAGQAADGHWESPAVTALCLRALSCGHGQGVAIDRGLRWLGDLQRAEGCWPIDPAPRVCGDELTTAFILIQVAPIPAAREALRIRHAAGWLRARLGEMDAPLRRLAERALARAESALLSRMPVPSWS